VSDWHSGWQPAAPVRRTVTAPTSRTRRDRRRGLGPASAAPGRAAESRVRAEPRPGPLRLTGRPAESEHAGPQPRPRCAGGPASAGSCPDSARVSSSDSDHASDARACLWSESAGGRLASASLSGLGPWPGTTVTCTGSGHRGRSHPGGQPGFKFNLNRHGPGELIQA
jgi:hypothetical protein